MQKDNTGEFPDKRQKKDFSKKPGPGRSKSSGKTTRASSRKDDLQNNQSARVSKDEAFSQKVRRRPPDNARTEHRSGSDDKPRRHSLSGNKPDQLSDRPGRSPARRSKPVSRDERPRHSELPNEKPRRYPSSGEKTNQQGDRPRRKSADRDGSYSPTEKPGTQKSPDENYKKRRYSEEYRGNKSESTGARRPRGLKADPNGPLRLNKFIANAGICSRREADKLIEAGAVKVNGVIVTELGTKVSLHDKVQLGDQTLSAEKLRYVLLNKPKDYITTVDDPFKRNTVMQLVREACRERIYPVGRLDRNTTGLLLFTNDGELTRRLTHPRFGVRKIYDVELDKPLSRNDFESIASGVELDGDVVTIDEIAYVELDKNKKHIGIELHSGQNHVVRRIFEKFGYEVVKLDRVMFGPLTKKNLPRGRWRHLEDSEVRMLKRL